MTLKIKLFICFLLVRLFVSSQERIIPKDSLEVSMDLIDHYYDTSKHGDALRLASRLLKTAEYIESDTLIAQANNSLGISFMAVEDYDKAINYYNKSLSIYKKLKIAFGIRSVCTNMGISYAESGDFETAKKYYFEALNYAETSADTADVYHDLGYDYGQNGFYEKSIEYLDKVIPLIKNNKTQEGGLGYSYYALYNSHYNLGNIQQANSYYHIGLKHAKSIDFLDLVTQFYEKRLEQLKKENKNEEALVIVDSIFDYNKRLKEREKLNVYKEVEAKLHIKDNNEKLQLIKNEKEAQKLLNIVLIALLSILLLLGILVFKKNKLLNLSIQKLNIANKTIKKSLLEKELLEQQLESIQDDIMRDIQDNFGNQLSRISNSNDIFLTLSKNEDFDNKKLTDFKQNLEKSLKSLTENLKEFIWINKSKNNSLVLTLNKLELYIYNLKESDKSIFINLETNMFKDEYKLPKYWNRQLFLILRDTIDNAIEYSKPSHITVVFSINEDNKLTIITADNGHGFQRDNLLISPYFFNVKRRTETMGYTMELKPESGDTINRIIIEGKIPNM
mgnify:CR=1 FL=1